MPPALMHACHASGYGRSRPEGRLLRVPGGSPEPIRCVPRQAEGGCFFMRILGLNLCIFLHFYKILDMVEWIFLFFYQGWVYTMPIKRI